MDKPAFTPLSDPEPPEERPVVSAQPAAVVAAPARAPVTGDDLLVWAALLAPIAGGVAEVLIPLRKYAITAAIVAAVVSIALLSRDAKRLGRNAIQWTVALGAFFPVAFLVYLHARKRWGAPWRLLHGLIALAILTTGFVMQGRAWGPAAVVTVSCRPKGAKPVDGYICSPSHLSGYKDARACWDLVVVCENGTVLSEHACAQVVLGARRDTPVPYDYDPGVEDCTTVTEERIDNLHVEVDP
ncbi:MAG: hypothetical protein U0271_35980 [Polyangiaceae bacterium]